MSSVSLSIRYPACPETRIYLAAAHEEALQHAAGDVDHLRAGATAGVQLHAQPLHCAQQRLQRPKLRVQRSM